MRGGARGGGTTYNVHFFPLNRSGALAGVFLRGRAYERMHGREYNGFGVVYANGTPTPLLEKID